MLLENTLGSKSTETKPTYIQPVGQCDSNGLGRSEGISSLYIYYVRQDMEESVVEGVRGASNPSHGHMMAVTKRLE